MSVSEQSDNLQPELHRLREVAKTPEKLTQEEKGEDYLSNSDTEHAKGMMEYAFRRLNRMEGRQDMIGDTKEAEFGGLMQRLDTLLKNGLVARTNDNDYYRRFKDPEAAHAELVETIGSFLNQFSPEGLLSYDKLTSPEEKKDYVRNNIAQDKELQDPYFVMELIKDFGDDREFSMLVISYMRGKELERGTAFHTLIKSFSAVSPEIQLAFAEKCGIKEVWEFRGQHMDIFESTRDLYSLEYAAKAHSSSPEKFEAAYNKVNALPEEQRRLFVYALMCSGLYSDDFKQIFKTQENIDLLFEIGELYENAGIPSSQYMNGFNALYQYGPGNDGVERQISVAKKASTTMLVGMLSGCSRREDILNCSHRELTKALCQREPKEVLDSIGKLNPNAQADFLEEMIARARLGDVSAALKSPELQQQLADMVVKRLGGNVEQMMSAPGFESTLQIPTVGELIFKGFIDRLDTSNGRGKALRNYLLVRFEDHAKRCGVELDPAEMEKIKAQMRESTTYDSKEALKDKAFTVVTLFTTDMKIMMNNPKDLWMQNSDFLRTYKAFLGEGYKLEESVGRKGQRSKAPFGTDKEADRLVEATLAKTVNGIRIVQRLVKSGNAYQDMTATLNNPAVDMVVQRGHCWDADESFSGENYEGHQPPGKQPLEQNPSRRKPVIIGGCFQARNLEKFDQHIKGEKPYFVATSKTGRGEITIPLTTAYAESIVRAATGNPTVDMAKIDADVRRKLGRKFETVPEADGIMLVSALPNILRGLSAISGNEEDNDNETTVAMRERQRW